MTLATETISTRLQARIGSELEQRRAYSAGGFCESIEGGQGAEVLEDLVFFADPSAFQSQAQDLLRQLSARVGDSGPEARERTLEFVVDIGLAVGSFLPFWNLKNPAMHGDEALTDRQAATLAGAIVAALRRFESLAPEAATNVLARRRGEAQARLKAENAADPGGMAAALAGKSLVEFVTNSTAAFARSNLRRLAELRARGESVTEIGNDYAAFIQHAMYLGASFVTTNPVLVDTAWVADPDRWRPIMDRVVAANPDAGEEGLARLATLEVVLANMRLLRPIFLLTGGKLGYVSLQINPKKHGDSEAMIADATALYAELVERLNGGVPNVVFKLPGTLAGLDACRHVTGRGVGVNITVNFAMFQQLRFAEVIGQGAALAAYLTEMNGRMAFPVRDELLSKLNELAGKGIGEAEAREAAAWAGVAITKRLHGLLEEKGYDLTRVRPLVASLRWYSGDEYAGLPNPCPDVLECAGVSVITIFPDIRHGIDGLHDLRWRPSAIELPVPQRMLAILSESELFKQAYHVADTRWLADDGAFKPRREIALEDEPATAGFEPVRATLAQFAQGYDTFVQRILGRKALLAVTDAVAARRSTPPGAARTALTNVYDLTVAEGIELIAAADRDGKLAAVLKDSAVRAKLGAFAADSEAQRHYHRALAKHV